MNPATLTVEQRAKMCGTKKRFGGKLSAAMFRDSMSKRKADMDGQLPYECPLCRFWHLGHRKPRES